MISVLLVVWRVRWLGNVGGVSRGDWSGRGGAEIDKIIDGKIMGGRIIGNHQSHQ
jgi:hypothetical protein